MRILKFVCLTFIYNAAFGQSNFDKVSNLKFYLSQLKDNIYFARQYADSSKMIAYLDSIEAQILKADDYTASIVIVEDTVLEPSDAYSGVQEENKELEPEGDFSNKTKKGDFDMPEGNPFIDSVNPFKKTKTSLIIETGINNFNIVGSNARDAKVNPGGSWYWNFTLMKSLFIAQGLDLNFGFAFQRNRFRFSNEVVLTNVNETLSVFESVPGAKNDPKLIIDYLNVPVMAKIRFSKKVNLTLGGLVGYRVGTRQELDLKLGTVEVEEVRKNSFGLNNWNYAIKGGIGLNKLYLMGQYQLSNLFESKANYNYHTFMIGTMIKI